MVILLINSQHDDYLQRRRGLEDGPGNGCELWKYISMSVIILVLVAVC